MTDVRPFRALRYDPTRVDLDRVIAPPYDVISPEERAFYWDRDPHGSVRLELLRDPDAEAAADYHEAAESLAGWRREGVLRLDPEPALYALRQRFAGPDGETRIREGVFALLHLEDYERRIVRPHERTLAGPKADRLKLLRATRANLSAIFLLYEDPRRELSQLLTARLDAGPAVTAHDPAGVEHRLAPVREPDAIAAVRSFLADRAVVIADGHHRYETALAYRDECRAAGAGPEAPSEWVMVYLTDAHAPGSLLLPIHRVLHGQGRAGGRGADDATWQAGLPGWSEKRIPCPAPEAIGAALAEHLAPLAKKCHAFAADDGSGWLRVFSRARRDPNAIDTGVLHAEVLRGVFGVDDAAVRAGAVGFAKTPLEAALDVRAGRGAVALYLNPLRPDDVFRVTAAGELMPQKSTFYHPKLPTGLCFRLLDEEAS
jgi:uncharacterized protein (DUF1015 family)